MTTRQMTPAAGGAQANWNVTPVDGATQHGSTTVSDVGANSSKVWTFGTSGASLGLATSYEERGPGGVALVHTDYTWSADNGNVYVGTVVKTRNPGTGQVQTKSTQMLDGNGNLTQSAGVRLWEPEHAGEDVQLHVPDGLRTTRPGTSGTG